MRLLNGVHHNCTAIANCQLNSEQMVLLALASCEYNGAHLVCANVR